MHHSPAIWSARRIVALTGIVFGVYHFLQPLGMTLHYS